MFSYGYLLLAGAASLASASSIQAAVQQLEAEADAIIQMVREGQRARRQLQTATVSMMTGAGRTFILSLFIPPPPLLLFYLIFNVHICSTLPPSRVSMFLLISLSSMRWLCM